MVANTYWIKWNQATREVEEVMPAPCVLKPDIRGFETEPDIIIEVVRPEQKSLLWQLCEYVSELKRQLFLKDHEPEFMRLLIADIEKALEPFKREYKEGAQ